MNKILNSRFSVSVGLALSALSLVACGVDSGQKSSGPEANGDSVLQDYLVAQVNAPGYSISFYELEPGSLYEFEKGELASRVEEPADLDAVQRFEYLTHQKAPKALVDALARAKGGDLTDAPSPNFERAEEEGTAVVAPDVVEKGVGWGSESWFRSTYCVKTDRTFGNFDGGSWWGDSTWRDGVEYLKGGVHNADGQGPSWDPDYDDLSYRQGYSGGNIPDQWYGLLIGQYAAWRNTSSIDRQASSAVRYADTNRYVHCLNYHY